jgi:hypothetical protein
MRTSVTKRLGAVTAIVLFLAIAACSSGATDASPEDRARASCATYLEAYDARDQARMDAAVADVITLANEQQDPETAQPGLASLVATTVLAAGPLPWQPQQYGLLRQACVAFIAG